MSNPGRSQRFSAARTPCPTVLDGSAMPSPEHSPLPDIAVGHHPEYGIVAANPKQLAAGAWMLEHLDFRPVPGHPSLYALAEQDHNATDRASRAVSTLRTAGYAVNADPRFEPSLAAASPPIHADAAHVEPDVAFAEHPQLGVVAATADTANAAVRGGQLLEQHGWRHNPHLDIYTLPVTVERGEALGKVAQAAVDMQRAELRVAVHPRLAEAVTTRCPPAPASGVQRKADQGSTAHRFATSAAALATSPARSGIPGRPPVPLSAAALQPVDPRVAFSRNR